MTPSTPPSPLDQPGPSAPETLTRDISRKDAPALQAALAAGLSPNALVKDGQSLLSLASETPENPCCFVLLDAGARPEGSSADQKLGFEPLVNACLNCDPALVRALIRAGAPVSIVSSLDFCLISRSLSSPDCVAALIEAGAELNHPSFEGSTPCMSATFSRHDSLNSQRLESLFLLIEAGADLTLRNNNGQSALDLCAIFNNPSAAGLISSALERKALLLSTPAAPRFTPPGPRL